MLYICVCRTNQWTGLYMIGNSVMKELKVCEKAKFFDVVRFSCKSI